MVETSHALVAIAATGLLLGAGFALSAPVTETFEEFAEDGQAAGPQATALPQDDDGEMTAEESEQTHEGVDATAPPFYASRVVTLEGEITLEALPVVLANVNGEIDVEPGSEDEGWRLVANMTGYGPTPEEARAERDEMSLAWSIGSPGDRHLEAEVDHEDDEDEGLMGTDASRKEARMVLRLPADLLVDLTATLTNGDVRIGEHEATAIRAHATNGEVHLEDVVASQIDAGTTNGLVSVEAEGTQRVSLSSTNGDVDAELDPGASGSISATTTNGAVSLSVPETSERGYDVTATTTNGQATIALEDGDSQRSQDGSEATFLTDGFAQRDVRTSVAASSTNGDVHVAPS